MSDAGLGLGPTRVTAIRLSPGIKHDLWRLLWRSLSGGARSVAAILARTGECRDIAVPLIFSWFRPG